MLVEMFCINVGEQEWKFWNDHSETSVLIAARRDTLSLNHMICYIIGQLVLANFVAYGEPWVMGYFPLFPRVKVSGAWRWPYIFIWCRGEEWEGRYFYLPLYALTACTGKALQYTLSFPFKHMLV